ncbi:MAG: hypothetical protein AAGA43_15780 [Bacteroidota bacterium]
MEEMMNHKAPPKQIIIRPRLLFAIIKPFPSLILGAVLIMLIFYLSGILVSYFPSLVHYAHYFDYALWAIGVVFMLHYLYVCALILSRKYIISSEKLNYTRGVFSIQTDYIELYRVKDFIEKRPFTLRLINAMVLTMITSDFTDKIFTMQGIPRSNIGMELSELVEINRVKKGVREID